MEVKLCCIQNGRASLYIRLVQPIPKLNGLRLDTVCLLCTLFAGKIDELNHLFWIETSVHRPDVLV